jgi:hypothetical protein
VELLVEGQVVRARTMPPPAPSSAPSKSGDRVKVTPARGHVKGEK